MNFCLISYDIRDDTRRTRIHDLLKNHGLRVQFSVFECCLSERRFLDLHRQLLRLLDPSVDSIRFYKLCRKCLVGVEVAGVGVPPDEDDSLPIIL
jgi:CRISPR-associated protein Cas2